MIFYILSLCQRIFFLKVSIVFQHLFLFRLFYGAYQEFYHFCYMEHQFHIYGYLFLVAITLGVINVIFVFKVGRPLKKTTIQSAEI